MSWRDWRPASRHRQSLTSVAAPGWHWRLRLLWPLPPFMSPSIGRASPLEVPQSLVAVTDVVTPVLAGFILGQGLYGAWMGAVVAIALTGAAIAGSRLPRIDPETNLEQPDRSAL